MKTLTNYRIEINFSTDKVLTFDQLANLENAILLQIEEPTDYDQNAVRLRAEISHLT